MEEILKQLGALRGEAPSCAEAQRKIEELQRFITLHYYQCTNEILAGLGEMYVADERMRKNIDKAGGEGTAAFTAQAIAIVLANSKLPENRVFGQLTVY